MLAATTAADDETAPADDVVAVAFQEHPVHEAMAFCSETDAYFQAVAHCPDLVEEESPHDLFLRYCDYNLWDASQRLANYWRLRAELFASPFIPLFEALLEQDKEYLEKGSAAVLPPRQSDGMFVVFNDRNKLDTKSRFKEMLSRQRMPFFLFSLTMLRAYHEHGNSEGELVVLVRVDNKHCSTLPSDWKNTQAIQRMLHEYLVKP